MTAIGLPVPAGFTVTTEACREYMRLGGAVPDGLHDEIAEAVGRLEERPASASATRPTRFSSPCARAPPSRCPG